MNERFAADPTCFGNSAELKNLLEKFGVFTGRYLTSYPDDWELRLIKHMSSASPLESVRISRHLQRAKECCGIIKSPMLMWMDHLSWANNAGKLAAQAPPRLDGLVVPNNAVKVPLKASTLDNFELPPTAEERIASTPEEYVRVMKMLLLISHELILVDPYLNPCKRYVAPVLESMLAVVAGINSKCRLVTCYARTRDILSEEVSLENIKIALLGILSRTAHEKLFKLNFHLIDDSTPRGDRMHDRYLLSVKGGIELSQGFQQQMHKGKVTVSPISPALHKEAWSIFVDHNTNMRIEHTIAVP